MSEINFKGRPAITRYRKTHKMYWTILTSLSLFIWVIPKITHDLPKTNRYTHQMVINELIKKNHPNPKLVKAIIKVESEGNPKAISKKGAIGLMQVMPESGRVFAGIYSDKKLFDPEHNIQAGCKILKYYQKTSPNLRVALHKYSGGANNYYDKVMKAMN